MEFEVHINISDFVIKRFLIQERRFVAHSFNALMLIDLIGIRQSNETTFGFYLIEGIRWIAKRKAITKTTKARLGIVQEDIKNKLISIEEMYTI